jgi:hypothetical protein
MRLSREPQNFTRLPLPDVHPWGANIGSFTAAGQWSGAAIPCPVPWSLNCTPVQRSRTN